jgi:hypothetical protein
MRLAIMNIPRFLTSSFITALVLFSVGACGNPAIEVPAPQAAEPARGAQPEEISLVELPAPTGTLAMGRMVFHWIDAKDRRELLVYLWYPAENFAGGKPALYFPEFQKLKQVLGEEALRQEFGKAYAKLADPMTTPAIDDAKVHFSGHRHPVLLFSHGLEEKSCFYTALIEDLVSHGYVVAAMEHPNHSLGVAYPDGRVVTFDRKKWKEQRPLPRLDPKGSDRFNLENYTIGAKDASFALDHLQTLDSGELASPFKGTLDLEHVGIFGHSLGGFVAGRAGELDQRFKACLNLDGWNNGRPFLSDRPGGGPLQPFMSLGSKFTGRDDGRDGPKPDSRKFVEALFRQISSGSCWVVINGFEHSDCTDIPILSAPRDGAEGAKRTRNMQIVRAYTRAFFDKHLRGKAVELHDGPSADFPEVKMQFFAPRKP